MALVASTQLCCFFRESSRVQTERYMRMATVFADQDGLSKAPQSRLLEPQTGVVSQAGGCRSTTEEGQGWLLLQAWWETQRCACLAASSWRLAGWLRCSLVCRNIGLFSAFTTRHSLGVRISVSKFPLFIRTPVILG